MQIKDIMTHGMEAIETESTLVQAAEKMKVFDIGMLPVFEGDNLVGVVTDRDIVVRALAAGQDPRSTRVHDVMTSAVIHCLEDQDIEEAIQIMEENQVRRLIVLDRNRQPVGIVSLGDLAVHVGEDCLVGECVRQVSEPSHVSR
ncbi:MAG: CBS domain-containing protein [Phycisphaerae bacterium]|jgi:CBS domain-containing protein|nr:CBS domain-containing protein [Phycisphaerae bacterium]